MTWRLLLALLCVQQAFGNLRGVAPEDASFYASGSITCPGTSQQGVVNDNYCDCPADGKDEPGTSACSKGRFYCVNTGFIPNFITSSRVDDRICDCCDGSDEEPGFCNNDCSIRAEALNAQTLEQIAEHEEGLKRQQQFAEEYRETLASKQSRATELEQQQREKEQIVASMEARVNQLQTQIDSEKEKHREELRSVVEAEAETRVTEFLERRRNEIAQEQAEKERVKQEQEAQQQVEGSEGTEGSEEQAETNEEPEEEPVVDLEAEAQSERQTAFEDIMRIKLAEIESLNALNSEKSNLEDSELRTARDELQSIKSELEKINEWLSADFGPDARFAYMHGQTFTHNTHEYEYKLSPYGEAQQGWTSVGNWEGWSNNYTVMKFGGGTRCWGGPDRSLTVYLSCGSDTVISEIREPAKCEYSMKLKTPGACTVQDLEELKAKIVK